MSNNYILIEDAVNTININADDLERNGGIPYAQGARAMAIVVEQMSPADVVPYSISDDGTMTITVPKGMAVGRVFVQRR